MKISEFLLVRTNFKIFPGWKAAPCRVQMDPVQAGAGGANRSTPSLHTMQKESLFPFDKLARLSLRSAIIRQFSLTWWLDPCNAAINHRSWSTITSHGNPLSRNFLSARGAWALSLSLSLSARRREEEEEEVRAACACGWAITPFPSPSASTRSDNIIIGFNLR